jgi:NADH-quinone oxidoreductase subunit E
MDYTCEKLGVQLKKLQQMDFEIKGVECLGACGYAPMMQLGDFYKEHLTQEKSIN